MLEVDHPSDMDALVGHPIGTSDWLTVDQPTIDRFAQATHDHQWIHTDPARARDELPGGTTIAHGFLTLSLIPHLARSVFAIKRRARSINYGLNRVRFTSPVPAGARIRAHQVLKASDPVEGGRRLTVETTIEIEGQPRPALVAEQISVVFAA